ncbi:MAG: siderophore-interacting protein [Candidatus Bathyarchaeia archaeon]
MTERISYEPKYHIAGVCQVVCVKQLTPRVKRITFHGAVLEGLKGNWRPEMLIRLYFPAKGHFNPPEPFLTPDGQVEYRTTAETEVSSFSAFSEDPLVRAFTARRFNPDAFELTVDFTLHNVPGLASDWARNAKTGDRLGIVEFSLPSGHNPLTAHKADVYVLCADESSLSSAQTDLEALESGAKAIAFVEVADELEEQHIDTKADLTMTWLHRGDAEPGTSGLLLKAIKELPWPNGKVFVWACGEMKTVTEIRLFLMQERGLQKSDFKCQAYWRRGKTEVERMARMTELSLAAAESNPDAFKESFENIGMDIVDPTLFGEQEKTETVKNEPEIEAETHRTSSEASKVSAISETWNITMKTPLGTQKATLYASIDSDKLTGKMDSRAGHSDIADGTINGNTYTWKASIRFPRRITFEFSAKVDGNIMMGTVKLGPLGQATFTGIKK